MAQPDVAPARQRCRVHDIAMGNDGRCLLCQREREPEEIKKNPWPYIGGGSLLCIALLAAYALMRPDPAASIGPEQPVPAVGAQVAEPLTDTQPVEPSPQPKRPSLADSRADREKDLANAMYDVSITLYGTKSCEHCKRARTWLSENDYAYKELDPETSETARDDLKKLNPKLSVPTFDIDGMSVIGFSEARVSRTLRRAAEVRLK